MGDCQIRTKSGAFYANLKFSKMSYSNTCISQILCPTKDSPPSSSLHISKSPLSPLQRYLPKGRSRDRKNHAPVFSRVQIQLLHIPAPFFSLRCPRQAIAGIDIFFTAIERLPNVFHRPLLSRNPGGPSRLEPGRLGQFFRRHLHSKIRSLRHRW